MPRLRQPPPTRLMVWTAFWVFLLDQATKWLVVHWLDLRTRLEIDVLPPLVNFRMAWNRGVNFGLFADVDMRWVLIALALAISGFVVVWVTREGGSRLVHVSAGLLVGGALGNVIDRALYGAVADFLNMSCCGIENPYAFNVADIAVFAGAVGLVLFAGRGKGKAQPVKPVKPARPAKTG
ncbi:signal peptidase II [Rubellimicrobium rubrum]|uniref:Lipoprotein signal peptidase n=1 Tax=Rubellimicrobium rubrum TaxID=2585369 RepID=A0A5C4MXF2_9RHOB|nr:signal peptidase II [Rubellimicrobium rubrum]TNC48785.1 signal peptidase II [Rubellimicrobium rubrum]